MNAWGFRRYALLCTWAACTWFGIFVLRAYLTPDTDEYASGQACWSSLASCSIGATYGRSGLDILSWGSAILWGYLLIQRGGMRRAGAAMVFPATWYAGVAGADSVGAFGVAYFYRQGRINWRKILYAFAAISAMHLVAGLCFLVYNVGNRLRVPKWISAVAGGTGACLGEWHFQPRYFIPCITFFVIDKMGGGEIMRNILRRYRHMFVVAAVVALSAVFVGTAGATPVVPAIPVASYGDSLLTGLGTAVTAVFPYAAAITVFAIGVGLVRRWLGHKKATRV